MLRGQIIAAPSAPSVARRHRNRERAPRANVFRPAPQNEAVLRSTLGTMFRPKDWLPPYLGGFPIAPDPLRVTHFCVWIYSLVQPAVKPKCFSELNMPKGELRRPRRGPGAHFSYKNHTNLLTTSYRILYNITDRSRAFCGVGIPLGR